MPEALSKNSPLFPSDSVIWRLSREKILLTGGPAAAILQIAHPQIALGVARHSDFRNDTLGRLQRTLEAVYTITFSSRAEVEAMEKRVRASHAQVRGHSPQPYSAFSPDAQMWVLATLIKQSVQSYERYFETIPPDDLERYYRDMRVFGTVFGLPENYGPQTWEAFDTYYRTMLEDPQLGHLPESTELAHHVAYPRKPFLLRILWPFAGTAAREYLPPHIGTRLGLPRTAFSRTCGAVLTKTLRTALPRLPGFIRYVPHYRKALKKALA